MGTSGEVRRLYPSVVDRAYEQAKKNRLVRDIMSRDVSTTGPGVTMAEAAKVMGERHIGSLIVVRDGEPVGIVTERDLLSGVVARGRSPGDVKVWEVASRPLMTVSPTATVKEAAQAMIRKRGRLAVLEEGKLVGIVTASDLIRSLPDAPETILKVDQFMTRRIVTADERTTVDSVAQLMGEKRIGSVIVTRGGEPVGIFTERDLVTRFLAEERPMNVPVGENASSPLVTAPSWISVHQAAAIMASRRVRRLPLTEDGKIVGIITARDLVEAYAK